LPNVGPYIYDVSISGFTRSSIYIYDISSLRVNLLQVAQNYELVRIGQLSTWPKLSGANRSVLSIYKTNFKLKSGLKHGSSFRYYVHAYIDCENTCSARSVGNRTSVCTHTWYIICQICFM